MDLPEILLLVAEHAELTAISALACTNKKIFRVIRQYERSICVSRLKGVRFPPQGDHLLSTRYPDDGHCQERFPRLSLDALGELELREKRIRDLVAGTFLSANNTIPDECRPRYMAGLERAIHLCDQMADMSHSDNEAVMRETQVELINSLSPVDLAFFFEIAWMGSIGWARTKGPETDSDPDTWYKALAFEELVLRRGSLFLWGWAMGPAKFQNYSEKQIQQVARDIMTWELGEGPQLPSLRLCLFHAFMAKTRCTFAEAAKKMAIVVGKEAEGTPIKKKDED